MQVKKISPQCTIRFQAGRSRKLNLFFFPLTAPVILCAICPARILKKSWRLLLGSFLSLKPGGFLLRLSARWVSFLSSRVWIILVSKKSRNARVVASQIGRSEQTSGRLAEVFGEGWGGVPPKVMPYLVEMRRGKKFRKPKIKNQVSS